MEAYTPTRRARLLIDTFDIAYGPVPHREKLIEMIATALSFEQLAATPYTRDATRALGPLTSQQRAGGDK